MALSLAEQMFYCATKVATFSGPRPLQTGTGFFYVVHLAQDRTRDVHLLVTNKHVMEGADRIGLTFHKNGGDGSPVNDGEFFNVFMNIGEGSVIAHPNPDIDLCAIAMGQTLNMMRLSGRPLFYVALEKAAIPTDEIWAKFDVIEKITMIGCPNGLFDTANNMPIARSGSTATDITKKYQGKSEFLIDLACFPGSSGSPVFVYDPNGGLDRGSATLEIGRVKLWFVGILYAGPTINNLGEIQLARRPTFQFASMMHLGQVIRSTEILTFDRLIQEMDAGGRL
ncbi:S1 family peptidase [Mesorhizobium sp. J8]|uniref:S1 family peptidase n=1 Tax=Mesorhizobium sp. J8 TaxID=2777475 RepID=UPI001916604B|nr:serine protease [Mesorhizobium sp. J8]BCM19193.1 hypothetical protein MJ8_29650 [Mesorhizobium sp. J8]